MNLPAVPVKRDGVSKWILAKANNGHFRLFWLPAGISKIRRGGKFVTTVASDVFFIGVLVLLLFLILWGGRKRKKNQGPGPPVPQQGLSTKADETCEADTAGDLGQMLEAVSTITNPIDRHYLFKSIVEETYKKRKDPEMRKIFKEIGEKHISEFENLIHPLKERFKGTLPRVETFQYLATVLSEDGDYEYAIEICKTALRYGLHDNTKTGFKGRIMRIESKRRKLSRIRPEE